MPASVPLRRDFDARHLRKLASRCKDARQSRRLLSLAAFYVPGTVLGPCRAMCGSFWTWGSWFRVLSGRLEGRHSALIEVDRRAGGGWRPACRDQPRCPTMSR